MMISRACDSATAAAGRYSRGSARAKANTLAVGLFDAGEKAFIKSAYIYTLRIAAAAAAAGAAEIV